MLIKDPISIFEEFEDLDFVVMLESISEFFVSQEKRKMWCDFKSLCSIEHFDENTFKFTIPVFEFSDDSKNLRGEHLVFSTSFLRVCCNFNPLSKFGLRPFRIQTRGFKFWENLEIFGNGLKEIIERFESNLFERRFTKDFPFFNRIENLISAIPK